MGMIPQAIDEVNALERKGSFLMETHMVTAAIKFDQGDWRELLPLSRRLRQVFPKVARWILYEAEAIFHLEDVWAATACVLRVLPRFPRETEFRYLLHYLHDSAGNPENAAYWLREALRLDSEVEGIVRGGWGCQRVAPSSVLSFGKKARGESKSSKS